ncbi:MAG: oxidoreductase [Candidatus Raymondbacteria bacterium RifOxyA12_full_50_37]|nr:MAG: oxidoreductase [Candidatus Raymondbacteria bacterium RifOxyA12_full_50_37]OGJ92804.1 MAG: oxidoreductase [Candidatus Raymondbacteria bacterium RIFOXYA2_FULL_49_16]OGK03556.1 MAG: oxidoreductase [Candidatus Raymondbacteria bacterium RifOxyC12_full_50_8]OGP44580.1 MAG: oxidoreductase [Candidatus Raymondbacteria bacterium RIFOXYB2_FULL_49_35]
MKPVTYIIAGTGGRGQFYAEYCHHHPDRARVVGVADPNPLARQHMAKQYAIPAKNIFLDWKEMAKRPKFADAVIVATQDSMHEAPAKAFAQKKYALLLEKPMAPTEKSCRGIVAAVLKHKILFGVCHVLRYTRYTQAIKTAIRQGLIGDLISMQHLEPVGFWHQAHSFVRGNWRNEAESSPMLLAKSCHDLDWIRYMMDAPCTSISSFGNLTHFKKSGKPQQAGRAIRCLDCAYEPQCPYSAVRLYYRDRIQKGDTSWPLDRMLAGKEPTKKNVIAALRTGPYGRCVYECDNNVVDHQVVNMEFKGGKTAAFTMTAFTGLGGRRTRLFGTMGEMEANEEQIRVYCFRDQKWKTVPLPPVPQSPMATVGHAGGDYGLMEAFTKAVALHDPSKILSGPRETLESHLMVFAAEKARQENRVITF